MPTTYDNRNTMDKTIRIFDSFYQTNLIVDPNEYDIVLGYFTSVCATKNIAQNFTALFFRIAQEAAISALDLLNEIKGLGDNLKMNKVICYYLNTFKSKTSLYGISLIPLANQPVARNVIQ